MPWFRKNMTRMFNPASVAVVGASDNSGKLGYHVMKSLVRGGYGGRILPVNPTSREIFGIGAHPSISDVAGAIDLAVVVVPAGRVAGVLRECAEKRVGGVVLITAGFKEIDDPAGLERHNEIAGIADRAGMPVIGPNTFGMINFHAGVNASFTPEFSQLPKGNIALVSQSGGMAHLLGFLAMRTGVSFSSIVGLGNRLNVDFTEMIAYLMDDPDTRVIMLYMEGIDDPRKFMAAIRECNGRKPVVAYKTGSSEKGDQAAKSHTGSLAGRHDIYRGAFRQAGIFPVDSAEALLDSAKALAGCPLPERSGVAVLSGQAGPGMAACDAGDMGGLHVVGFAAKTQEKIDRLLPPVALRTNPVDMGPAWYDTAATLGIIEAAMSDRHVGGVLLLIMFASANVNMLRGLRDFLVAYGQKKPVVGCIAAPPGIWDKEIRGLEDAGALVNFPTPERAARAMGALWQSRRESG